ncbi:hypothetical protein AUC47_10295 [Microbacterium sp. SZ1]|nr:hypothetical protein AUC47_10295 [Microbacterium sp. SZ1]
MWLDYRQAARRIERSESTIKRYRRDGMPMPLRDGRRVVHEDVLLSWYRERLTAWPIHQQRLRVMRARGAGR